MPRTIEIDEDVFYYLLGRSGDSGRSISEVLRAAFALDKASSASHKEQVHAQTETGSSDIQQLVKSARFLRETTALGRFLVLLSHFYQKHKNEFDSVTQLHGRRRRYIARSKKDLEDAGTSVDPKQIPGSPYWVVTNLENPRKKTIIEGVMRMMAYDEAEIRVATEAI